MDGVPNIAGSAAAALQAQSDRLRAQRRSDGRRLVARPGRPADSVEIDHAEPIEPIRDPAEPAREEAVEEHRRPEEQFRRRPRLDLSA